MQTRCFPNWITGNPHIDLLRCWPSLYAAAQATGIDYGKIKRWARNGRIADRKAWRIIAEAAGMDDPDAWVVILRKRQKKEKS